MRGPAGHFLPGASGNPGGKPRGPNVMHVLQRQLAEVHAEGDQTKLEALVAKIIEQAIAGKAEQQKLILDRLAPLKLVLEGSEDGVPVVRLFTSGPKVIEAEKVEEKRS